MSFVPIFWSEAKQTCPTYSPATYSSLGRSLVGVLTQGSVRVGRGCVVMNRLVVIIIGMVGLKDRAVKVLLWVWFGEYNGNIIFQILPRRFCPPRSPPAGWKYPNYEMTPSLLQFIRQNPWHVKNKTKNPPFVFRILLPSPLTFLTKGKSIHSISRRPAGEGEEKKIKKQFGWLSLILV